MDQKGIQSKVNLGYGKAAAFLGAPYKLYRPSDPFAPLKTILRVVMADFDQDPLFTYKAPSKYGNSIYYGLFDGTNVKAGDYLVGPQGTFAAVGFEPNKPVLCIACNQVISVLRPNPNPVGNQFYGGDLRGAGELPILTGWPASLLQGTKGERGASPLPGDTRMPWVVVLLPSLAGTVIETTDRLSDDLGRFWTVSSVELTNLGWRLTAMLADT